MTDRREFLILRNFVVIGLAILLASASPAQDVSTGAIHGTVRDATGAVIRGAEVSVQNASTGLSHAMSTDDTGSFSAQLLPPGEYAVEVRAQHMGAYRETHITVHLGADIELPVTLQVSARQESVTVSADALAVETRSSEPAASVVDERAIAELPINGRRFSDLALLTPGVTQDPRSLTSGSNGDLSSGGIRGFQTTYLVDGGDNNNTFFAQARGRYRAPFQFSNDVIQEFRVSSHNYSAESGRAGAAVVNVVTKSGSNQFHGNAFYYLRDRAMDASNPFVQGKPEDRQQQFGGTVGGPIKKNRMFFFAGFDQHIFHVPTVVQFNNGSTVIVPGSGDYEASDQALVAMTAASLSNMGGNFKSELLGNAGFIKFDTAINSRNLLTSRFSTSRYYGSNNVYFDPASPITHDAMSENGEEDVTTDTASESLTSSLWPRVTSHLRVQFSHDLQTSSPNAPYAMTEIVNWIYGFGRSNILPRETNENKWHIAETIAIDSKRHAWKLGGDALITNLYNFYPLQFGGEYIFSYVKVNPFTFVPQEGGLDLSPLRAYAHDVPRYYMQNFGSAVSRPDTNQYSGFLQDTIRVTPHFALTLGARYDLQIFSTAGLVTNPLWPEAGHVPNGLDRNIAPRVGLAYGFGGHHPLVLRGGYGVYYTGIPAMYRAQVQTDNGVTNSYLNIDNADYYGHQIFPAYPNALVNCPLNAASCVAPTSVASMLTTDVSAFAANFQTPFVQQMSASLEREIADRVTVTATLLHVRGDHLIRARDINLPPPVPETYPLFDSTGQNFTGQYYTVQSFGTWQTIRTSDCSFPPCLNPVQRPIPNVGPINVYESAATSIYNGAMLSVQRRVRNGIDFRISYTWAEGFDDGQDALLIGRPSVIQNTYDPHADWGRSSIDQRHRLVASWNADLPAFHGDTQLLRGLCNTWTFSGIATYGSGRPLNARILGDANADGNSSNDRLPGVARNAFVGPDFESTDIRLSRKIALSDRVKLQLLAEVFNIVNHANKRMDITDDGFLDSAASFQTYSRTIGASRYPAYFEQLTTFRAPNNAYAPRQVQFAAKLLF